MLFKASFLVASVAAVSSDEWEAWKQRWGRIYNDKDEENFRRSVFEGNMAKAAEQEKLNPYAELGATKFSDMTEDEFSGMLGGEPNREDFPRGPALNLTLPVTEDKEWWHNPVRDQGRCGSCWAFASVGTLESMYFLKTGSKLEDLSPQQLVDCGKAGDCTMGSSKKAFTVINELGGIELEKTYPYKGKNGNCAFNKRNAVVSAQKGVTLTNSEAELEQYLSNTGPIATCGGANEWTSYKGGILSNCPSKNGHCFQMVGLGTENGVKYWKVRNSWGTGFGENGYIRIQRGIGACGLGWGVNGDPVQIKPTPTPAPTPAADDPITV